MIISLFIVPASMVSAMNVQANGIQSIRMDHDPWTMFHHDLTHAGVSTSEAPDTNHLRWSQGTISGITSSPALVDGKLYLGSYDGTFYCFNAKTGEQKWSFYIHSMLSSSPAVVNGKVYFGVDRLGEGIIYCLEASSGQVIWSYLIQYGGMFNGVSSSPAVADGKVYIGSMNGIMYCFDAIGNGDGTTDLLWMYHTNGAIESSPAIVNGKVYVGSDDGYLYCLGGQHGNFIWKFDTGYLWYRPWQTAEQEVPPIHVDGWIWSSPAVVNGNVYFSEGRGKIYCLNAESGRKIWSYATGEWGSPSSPAVADGRVYIGTFYEPDYQPRYGNLYCFDALTGFRYWNYTTENFILSSPAVADKKVYVGCFDNSTYCLNARTGTLIWKYTTEGVIRTSPAIYEGRMYIACYHELPEYQSVGRIYCFEDL